MTHRILTSLEKEHLLYEIHGKKEHLELLTEAKLLHSNDLEKILNEMHSLKLMELFNETLHQHQDLLPDLFSNWSIDDIGHTSIKEKIAIEKMDIAIHKKIELYEAKKQSSIIDFPD